MKKLYPQVPFRSKEPDAHPNPWVTRSLDVVYDNPWIRVSHREVSNPSGGAGIYGVVHFKNIAIGIVPLDQDGYTWLVGQYRYTLNRYSWEIPEGGCPQGSDMLESAKRELQEETGLIAKEWIPLMEMHTSNSVTDEYGVAFIARDLSQGQAMPEETEELQIRRIPFQEALEMVLNGEITDALSAMAIYKTAIWMQKGLI
ncbi:MAG: NUDIX hydrolase [Bacteroidetes bacterium]|nr:NUDIX hydrolase [Bacteroidota bacterium]